MSDTALVALITGLSTASVGIVATIFAFFTQKAHRVEQYRVALYPERLTRYQQAVGHLVELQNIVSYTPPLREDVRERFLATFRAADQWWTQNCLYLDPVSAEYLRKLFAEVGAWAVFNFPLRGTTPVHERFNEAWRLLWRGMGWKHVDTNLPTSEVEHDR